MKKSFLSTAVATVLVGSLIVACGSSSDTDPVVQDANVTNIDVGTNGNAFSPAEVSIKVGQTVRWTFKAGAHNVISGAGCVNDNKFGTGDVTQLATGTYEFKFDTAGDFEYFCSFHCGMGMKGIVRVTP